jgi:hypothetical protein
MKLIVVHQILIASAIGLALLFGVRALVLFGRGGGSTELVIAVSSIGVAVALSIYLRKVRTRWLAERGDKP